jgi:hypothetical protein
MDGDPIGCRKYRREKWLAASAWLLLAGSAAALDVVNYSATVNDRFTSGFPTAPVPNTSGSFIGLDYDWSGVAWSTTTYAASSYKGFGMLSPRHYLAATHYSAAAGLRLRLEDGTVVEGTPQSVTNTAFGFPISGTTPDIALGKLSAPITGFPAMARYAVLDLNNSSGSDSLANYVGQSLLVYGRGASTNDSPRIASSSITSATTTAYGANNGYMTSPTTTYTLVGGDSGSPAFIPWTNPNGGSELTIIGNNAAVDPGNNNIQNFIGRAAIMNEFNSIMNPDGFALRIEGNVSNTWVGTSSQDITNKGAWGIGPGPQQAPSDRYVFFDAATAGGGRSVVVDGASNQRGMYFKSAAAADGFTFSGASTLTIGRGGITNYDNSRQTISAPIALGASQYWDVGPGGVTAGAINTAGFLLEFAGSGTGIISGAVSGTGGVALSGTRLEMTGTSSYTGGTWVHSGSLVVNGSIATSSGVTVNAGGRLAGSGVVAAIAGSGSVDPGNSPGILTAPSVNPSGGLDFNFEFTQLGSPTWGNATASGNDVLRLTSSTAPFTAALTAGNAINVYLDVGTLGVGNTFRGGFFTDRDVDFLGSISAATFSYFVADAGGGVSYGGTSYTPYVGPFTFDWSTVVETATFSGGSETGYVTQFVVVPEPGTWLLVAVAVAGGVAVRARRRGSRVA